MSETSRIKFAGAAAQGSGIASTAFSGNASSISLPVNGYKKGNEPGFNRLDLSPPPAPWYEPDAVFAYSADNGAEVQDLDFIQSGSGVIPIPQDASQALPGAITSIPMSGNGTSDALYFVQVQRSPKPSISSTDFTVEFWAYFSVTPASVYLFNLFEFTDTSGYDYLQATMFGDRLIVSRSSGAPNTFSLTDTFSPASFPTNQWFKIKLTFTRTTRRFNLYINEVEVAEIQVPTYAQVDPITLPVTTEYAPVVRKAVNGNAYFDRYQIVPRII